MPFTLYSLIKASLLMLNALAILPVKKMFAGKGKMFA